MAEIITLSLIALIIYGLLQALFRSTPAQQPRVIYLIPAPPEPTKWQGPGCLSFVLGFAIFAVLVWAVKFFGAQ